MAAITSLPPGVTQDPNTGLYILTNSAGKTTRTGAQTQEELNSLAASFSSGRSTTVTSINPVSGNPDTVTFDPAAIIQQESDRNAALIADRAARKARNDAFRAANPDPQSTVPPAQGTVITPAAYAAAVTATDTVTNTPSILPLSPAPNSVQPPPGINAPAPTESPSQPTVLAGQEVPRFTRAPDVVTETPTQSTFVGDLAVEPLQQPADDFAGLDEAIALQKQPDLGELGINTDQLPRDQIQIDENGEPLPEATPDEKINAQLQADNPYSQAQSDAELEEKNADIQAQFESGSARGLAPPISSSLADTRSQATQQNARNANLGLDWRVKLSLAKKSAYLYNAPGNAGILAPLRATGGIVFPYTPSIQVTYAAHYDPTEITHSNYKIFQYKSSSVDSINITCDFTAQDTYEANYLLAVIHFLRSVTKMFYGQDNLPTNGTPPPLCYLTGMGEYQFNNHPLAIGSFTMNLPNDVDYIRATPNPSSPPGVDQSAANNKNNDIDPAAARKFGSSVPERGDNPPTKFTSNNTGGTVDPTYVPTKMIIQITAYPIVTRNDISKEFSLRDYATGALINRKSGGGMW